MFYQNIAKLIEGFIAIGIGLACFYQRYRADVIWKSIPPEIILKRKKSLREVGVICILLGVVVGPFLNWGNFHAEYSVHQINQQMAAIKQTMDKMPPGDERTAEFIRKLKAIDTNSAPPEVKEAMSDCIYSMEQLQQAAKTHQNTTLFMQACAQGAKALDDAMAKYQ